MIGNDHQPADQPDLCRRLRQGAYSRLDTKFYQGLNDAIISSKLPLVLPRYEYSYFGQPDALGGRLSLDAGAFNVVRTVGTNTRRASLTINWERPFVGALGDLWKVTLHGDADRLQCQQLQRAAEFRHHNPGQRRRARCRRRRWISAGRSCATPAPGAPS